MFKPKRVEDYVDKLVEKYDLPKAKIRRILMFGMRNIIKMIEAGEDVRIPKFGNIYFDKKTFSNYLKKGIKDGKKRTITGRSHESNAHSFSKSVRKSGSNRT